MENIETNTLSFRVDAGLIDRLGRELVGRAETAVSELIKNTYDADATIVSVNFIDTDESDGTIVISDNGLGMSLQQLTDGFMTISSTDKLHNPKSIRYNRSKAGKKGIGRFATQRLGNKLTIITQTIEDPLAIKLIIDWKKYSVDQDITKIHNPIEYIEKTINEGTILIIENVREVWSLKSIERVYRYISELLQPNYLSDRSIVLGLATQKDESFTVSFEKTTNKITSIIANPELMLFDKALAIIEGYVDNKMDGFYGIKSESLKIDDYAISIENTPIFPKFEYIHDIYFKVYYFIYDRPEYYLNISKLELNNILNQARENSGIRVYRNGFRVLPYGEPDDDWIGLDVRYSVQGAMKNLTNIPFGNRNLFGFVEVIDVDGILFEETASREGLIENKALDELKNFIHKALMSSRRRIAEGVTIYRKNVKKPNIQAEKNEEKKTIQENLEILKRFIDTGTLQDKSAEAQTAFKDLREEVEEISMLRVLAALGLTIAEYSHEITQYVPSINGYLSALIEKHSNEKNINLLNNLQSVFSHFTAYTSYFNATISQNISRELKPILIIDAVNKFIRIVKEDLLQKNIEYKIESYGYDLYTVPMHLSEWNSILFNLYTNSKKAIIRARVSGSIGIITGRENGKIYLEFTDNGDGIPDEYKNRVFNAFFTTSSPAGFEATNDEKLMGTGLGLKIVKDIVETYKGSITLISPEDRYSTCFRVEIPAASNDQLANYGI